MSTPETVGFAVVFFTLAALYSSVGNAGASGYLAVMALAGMAPDVMKPTALLLNVIVSVIATIRFYRAGHFSWRIFWPFMLSSVPLAAVGGGISVSRGVYSVIVGLILLLAAWRLLVYTEPSTIARKRLRVLPSLACGSAIGFVSGLTGIGGGIFLSPLLLLMKWADARQSASVASAFVLVNSVAALMGYVAATGSVPSTGLLWAVAAAFGALVGSELGVRRLAEVTLRRILAAVLTIAGLKLILAR